MFEDAAAGLAVVVFIAGVWLTIFAVWGLVVLVRLFRLMLHRKVQGTITAVDRPAAEGGARYPVPFVSYTVDGRGYTSSPLHGQDELRYAGVSADDDDADLIGRPMTLRVNRRRPERARAASWWHVTGSWVVAMWTMLKVALAICAVLFVVALFQQG